MPMFGSDGVRGGLQRAQSAVATLLRKVAMQHRCAALETELFADERIQYYKHDATLHDRTQAHCDYRPQHSSARPLPALGGALVTMSWCGKPPSCAVTRYRVCMVCMMQDVPTHRMSLSRRVDADYVRFIAQWQAASAVPQAFVIKDGHIERI